MRHFYFRLILGIVFIGCMIFSFVTMNIPVCAAVYLSLAVPSCIPPIPSGRRTKRIGGEQHEQHGTSFPQQFKRLVHRRPSRTLRPLAGFGGA